MTLPAHPAHIVGREIAPQLLAFLGLIALALLTDGALHLLAGARTRLLHTRAALLDSGLSPERVEEQLSWDTAAVDVVKQWRRVHFPITAAFVLLALAHIFASLLFGGRP